MNTILGQQHVSALPGQNEMQRHPAKQPFPLLDLLLFTLLGCPSSMLEPHPGQMPPLP